MHSQTALKSTNLSKPKPTLGRYLSLIHDGKYKDSKSPANRQFRFKQNPVLSLKRTNVILNYRGSFNPPHRGHLAVLWHAYQQLAKELNIIAAAVLFRSDESVQGKCSARNKDEVIRFEDRARLWKEDPNFPPWAWVAQYSKDVSFSNIERQLKKLARKDNCRIRFAELMGPDCSRPDENETSFDEMTIVSDVAREAVYDRLDGIQRFSRTGFSHWVRDDGSNLEALTRGAVEEERNETNRQQKIAIGEERARKAVQEKYSSLLAPSADLTYGASDLAIAKVDGLLALDEQAPPSPTASKVTEESLATQLSRLGEKSPGSVSVCWQPNREPKRSLRFLRTTPEQHAPFRGISSTLVQEKMRELQGYKLKEALESMALSPDLLWDLLLPPDLQREDADGNGCTMQCAAAQEVVPTSAPHLHPTFCSCRNRTLDDLFLPGGETKVFRNRAPTGGLGKRKRANSVDGEIGDATDGQDGRAGKKRKLCFTCFYEEVVEFCLHPREGDGFAVEDRANGDYASRLDLMAVSP